MSAVPGRVLLADEETVAAIACAIDPRYRALVLLLRYTALRWNEERGHYDFGECDWAELRRVVGGDGPCNRQRLEHHVRAHGEGAWVREAAAAYAAKHAGAGVIAA